MLVVAVVSGVPGRVLAATLRSACTVLHSLSAQLLTGSRLRPHQAAHWVLGPRRRAERGVWLCDVQCGGWGVCAVWWGAAVLLPW